MSFAKGCLINEIERLKGTVEEARASALLSYEHAHELDATILECEKHIVDLELEVAAMSIKNSDDIADIKWTGWKQGQDTPYHLEGQIIGRSGELITVTAYLNHGVSVDGAMAILNRVLGKQ